MWESQFKRDFKLITKRKKDLEKLEAILKDLQLSKQLPLKNRNHKLKGNYTGCWECHIEPDWLLIYKITLTSLILIRTGSHADLF